MPTQHLTANLPVKVLALAACFGLAAQPAAAATASFSIPVYSVAVSGGAFFSEFFLDLPKAGTPAFVINFVLPRDYDPGTDVKIVFHMIVKGSDCDVRFRASEMFRFRPGVSPVHALAGLSTIGATVHFPPQDDVVQKVFTLAPGGLSGQKAGDGFFVQFQRVANNAADTCGGSIGVSGIDIRYQTPP